MDSVKEELIEFIKSLEDGSDIEVEFRLGIKFPDRFSSNITKDIYLIIKNKLDKSASKGIFKKTSSEIKDFFQNGLRKSVSEFETVVIKKEKLFTRDVLINISPMDIRVSVSKEILKENDISFENYNYMRSKNRITYNYKNWNYDLTEITTFKNGLEEITYEFEIEIINNDFSEKNINSSFQKINEIIEMIRDQ